jgi:hypothetical protein
MMSSRRLATLSAALMIGALPSRQANADAGSLVQVSGYVVVARGEQMLPGTVGLTLQPGDTIQTGASGRAQVRMDDDSAFGVISGSTLKIERFERPRAGGVGSAVLSLMRGGFRTVTGLIGKMKGDAHEVRTPFATIGVRGTSYNAVICAGPCTTNGKYRAGLYVKADHGVVVVKNAHGEVKLRAGEIAFAESADTKPIKVKISPFVEPEFAIQFTLDFEFDFEVEPPRIEQEVPPSPS